MRARRMMLGVSFSTSRNVLSLLESASVPEFDSGGEEGGTGGGVRGSHVRFCVRMCDFGGSGRAEMGTWAVGLSWDMVRVAVVVVKLRACARRKRAQSRIQGEQRSRLLGFLFLCEGEEL